MEEEFKVLLDQLNSGTLTEDEELATRFLLLDALGTIPENH